MPYNWDAPIEIRDARNGDWFWVERYVWRDKRLTASDKVLYGTLAYFANGKDQQAFPSLTTLSEESQLSRMQVTRSIKKLKETGYINLKRSSGKVNKYQLLKNKPKSTDQSQIVTTQATSNNYAKTSNNYVPPLVTNTATNNNYLTRINNNKENSLKRIRELKHKAYELTGKQF